MKIKRLALAGFGPYKDEQQIDFTAFDDDGIFLITGKTGAGKSSILDAICYALYDSAPRYEGTQQKLRSDHSGPDDPTWVELDFSVGDTDYQVRRSPAYERPKLRGSGTTTTPSTAVLSHRVGEEWVGLQARPVDVGVALGEIVGLSKDQFLQVILLAQNRFQQFLKAGNDERQGVLRTLFGTARFARLEDNLNERRKQLAAALEGSNARTRQQAEQLAATLRIDPPDAVSAEWFSGSVESLARAEAEAAGAVEAADAEYAAADDLYRSLEVTLARQVRRDNATAALVRLQAESAAVESLRESIATAVRAAAVWPHVLAVRTAEDALATARTSEQSARAAFGDAGATVDTVSHDIDETTRRLGALSDALADEQRLPFLETAVTQAEKKLASRVEAVATASTEAAALPAELDQQSELLSATRVAAAQADPDAVGRLTSARAAAQRVEQLADAVTTARAAESLASRTNAEAAAEYHRLTELRLNGYAGELARGLVDGEPCLVCGSTRHPSPAAAGSEPVGQAEINAARATLDQATAAMDKASAHSSAVALELADAEARADGKSLEALDVELRAAQLASADALAAGKRVGVIEATIARLKQQQSSAADELDQLRASQEAAAAAVAEARSARDATATRVRAGRAEFASVAERATEHTERLGLARQLLSAIELVAARGAALETATGALDAQLLEHGFPRVATVEESRLERAALQAGEVRVREHAVALSAAQSTLADPELSDLPGDRVTLDATERIRARDDRDAARATQTTLAARRGDSERIVTRALDELAASADLQRRYDEVHELAAVVRGDAPNTMRMKLETYVLAAQLEEIVAAANSRLTVMTGGRYTLEHDDSVQYRNTQSGLGLAILDAHTGRSRATYSLSGGETFLASLALALGLAEVVTSQTGGITLDTLFIDEGFGSLDADTLDIAMSTLDGLRSGGRTIGLISHVDSMKEQITATLRVDVDSKGFSRVSQALA